MRIALPVLFALVNVLQACSAGPPVARVADGHDIDGHFITPEAYAAFMQGALLEEEGDLRGAAGAYVRALDEDSGAPEILARLGRVLCLQDRRLSDESFGRARRKGPRMAAVWLADAQCALDRDDARRARMSAERAAALDPRNAASSLVVIAALARTGDRAAAERWLRATRLLYPEAAHLPPTLDEALARFTFGRSSATRAGAVTHPAPVVEAASALDDALREGDGPAARDAAIRERVGLGFLALRAVELGQTALARESAEQTLAAEPGNVEARVAALAAADLARDEASLRRWATTLPVDRTPATPLSARVMTALLARRVGPGAARAFSDAWARAAHPR